MSAPDPATVNVPLFASYEALPPAPTAPMSLLDHPCGNVGGGGGGGGPLPPTLTWSMVAVDTAPSRWLVIASPTWMVEPIVMVSVPTTVQFEPSVDTDAVNVLPVRDICTQ